LETLFSEARIFTSAVNPQFSACSKALLSSGYTVVRTIGDTSIIRVMLPAVT
jgi:hypothetical protein